MRARASKAAVEVWELVLLADPDSADANEILSEACLARRAEGIGATAGRKGIGSS